MISIKIYTLNLKIILSILIIVFIFIFIIGCSSQKNENYAAGSLKEYEIIGGCVTPGFSKKVFIKGDYAYITDGKKDLKKIDISNNKNPNIVRNWDIPHYSSGVFFAGDYIYIANYEGLVILEDN